MPGWQFGSGPGTIADTVNGKQRLGEIYLLADPRYTGRVSVPVLWDKERRTIVNNELPEIIRMFNSAFAALTNDRADYYPPELARRHRSHQRASLQRRQYWRLPRRLRDRRRTPTKKAARAVFAALDWIEEYVVAPALSRQARA